MKKVILIITPVIVVLALLLINLLPDNKPETQKKYHISVVAAEGQYGSVAKLIGKGNIKVTNIINNPDGNPHTFISSVKSIKLFKQADVIIYNGADYDSWIDPILRDNKHAVIIKIQDLINYPKDKNFGVNPHFWYYPETFAVLATKLRNAFSEKDPGNIDFYKKNHQEFSHKYKKVYDLVKRIKRLNAGTPVTATEPLFGYMANVLGLSMKAKTLQWSIMNGSKPSPKMMISYQRLFNDNKVKVLFYNRQVTDNSTRNILDFAKQNGIAVIGVNEIMPTDSNAINWMIRTLQATAKALEKSHK